MKLDFFWLGLVFAGLAAPAFLYPYASSWMWGLWLGEGLGWGAFFWVGWTVRRMLRPGAAGPRVSPMVWHSLIRIGLIGLVFFVVLRFPAVSIWGVLMGYAVTQMAMAVWQRHRGGSGTKGKHECDSGIH